MIDEVAAEFKINSFEMETFHMFDLADCSKNKVIAGAACLVCAQRSEGSFIDLDLKHKMEGEMGKAGLETIIKVKLEIEMKESDFDFNKTNSIK